jgi:hypothetical protein
MIALADSDFNREQECVSDPSNQSLKPLWVFPGTKGQAPNHRNHYCARQK